MLYFHLHYVTRFVSLSAIKKLCIVRYIQKFPNIDSPEIIGLHPNADLTFRFKEVNQLLDTIVETQPKQSSGSAGGKTRGLYQLAHFLL